MEPINQQYTRKSRSQNTFDRRYKNSLKDRLGYDGPVDIEKIDRSALWDARNLAQCVVRDYLSLQPEYPQSVAMPSRFEPDRLWKEPRREQYTRCRGMMGRYLQAIISQIEALPVVPNRQATTEIADIIERCKGTQGWAIRLAEVADFFARDYFFAEKYNLRSDDAPRLLNPTKTDEESLTNLAVQMGLEVKSLCKVGWTPREPASDQSLRLLDAAEWLGKNLPRSKE